MVLSISLQATVCYMLVLYIRVTLQNNTSIFWGYLFLSRTHNHTTFSIMFWVRECIEVLEILNYVQDY